MIVVYIIGAIFFIALAVWFIDKRERLSVHSIASKDSKENMKELNQSLDEVIEILDEVEPALQLVNQYSLKLLKFFK